MLGLSQACADATWQNSTGWASADCEDIGPTDLLLESRHEPLPETYDRRYNHHKLGQDVVAMGTPTSDSREDLS